MMLFGYSKQEKPENSVCPKMQSIPYPKLGTYSVFDLIRSGYIEKLNSQFNPIPPVGYPSPIGS